MKTLKTVLSKDSVTFDNHEAAGDKGALSGDLHDEALDRPVGGISVQCACFTFSYSAGSPR